MKPNVISIRKGLDLPIDGQPATSIDDTVPVQSVGLLGDDYPEMKPRLRVEIGDTVKLGQVLFTDRKDERICFTSPAAGQVVAINRGQKRRFLSIEIRCNGQEACSFTPIPSPNDPDIEPSRILDLLLQSGLFTALRQRPFDRIPDPDIQPQAIFVPAIDTRPLAADPRIAIGENPDAFRTGLMALKRLTAGQVHLCRAGGESLPGEELSGICTTIFAGPHPAGLPGTHVHYLHPTGRNSRVWIMNYADVIEFGALLKTGELKPQRIVALGGPAAGEPRLIRTIRGAALTDLVSGKAGNTDIRTISGSPLYGHTATQPVHYLGRLDLQITMLAEGRDRRFLGWLFPDSGLFSVNRGPLARLINRSGFRFTTNLQGSPRAMVPIGVYEKVMPLDILPTFLVRAMDAGDLEDAEALGALELGEEDMTLCTFVDPGKQDLALLLRSTLHRIEREG